MADVSAFDGELDLQDTGMSSTPDCLECTQGKHGNCDGTSWNPKADDVDACPCQLRNHGHGGTLVADMPVSVADADAVGRGTLGETPECNGRCGENNQGGVDFFDVDRECPVHGDAAEKFEWCTKCEDGVEIADQFDDQLGFEEQARDVKVTALSCGHDIVRDMKGRTL